MAVKSEPPSRRGVIESSGQIPKVSPENEEDTETAIETPYAREHKTRDDDEPSSSRDRGIGARPSGDEGDDVNDDDTSDDVNDDDTSDDADAPDAASASASKKAAPAKGDAAKKPPAGDAPPGATPTDEGAPPPGDSLAGWLVPVYVASLLLLFVGERVVPTDEVLRYAFSGAGLLGTVATTLYRLRTMAAAPTGERRSVERILALLMAFGLLGIGVYFASTEAGRALLGIAAMKAETRARVAGVMTIAWIVILVVTVVPLVFGEIAFAPMRRAERIEARRVRAATLGGATIALAATYVAMFAYAAGELDYKLDFSYFRTSRPGESTKNVARSLTEPIEVTAFFPQLGDVGDEVQGYLSELAAASPQIQVKFQDRLLVPALAKELKVTQDGVLVLQRGTSRETMTIGAEMKTAQNKLKTLDADFQKTLLKVMRSQRVAYFTVGHGELNEITGAEAKEGRSAKNIKRLFESQNYLVKDLGLAQGLQADVPQDAHIVLVLGGSQAMLPEEVASIQRYAQRGGRLILALDPEGKVDFAPLAAAVGLTWKPAVLATDDARHFYPLRHNDSDRAILLTNRFSSHASVSSLSKISQKTAVVFRGTAALDKAEGTTANIDFAVRALAETFDDQNANFTFDKDAGEKRASYNVAAAITKPTGEKDKNGKDAEMRVFALGDADALSDGAVGDTPNGLMAIDVIRWLGGDESFLGAITSNEDVKIEHTKQKDLVWFYGTVFAVPLAVLGLGFFTTRRRRQSRPAPARRAS